MKELTKDNRIVFFMRNKNAGYSMHRVFGPVIDTVRNCLDSQGVASADAPCFRADPLSIVRNILWAYRHRSKDGINHVTGDCHYLLLGLIGCKKVLTIHDLVTLQQHGNKIKKWLLRKLWFELPLKKADAVTCISDKTRLELLKEFDISPDKITVVHNPIDATYIFRQKSFNDVCPRILHVGTGWNKNLERVIPALEGIPCVLVIIGQLTTNHLNLLEKHQIYYENKVGISNEQMFQEYVDCDIVSFPSLFEGFGMPIIEGQAIGRPVVTSILNPMKEIAGDGAAFVSPQDVESIRQTFMQVIENAEFRKQLVYAGLQNVGRFKVEEIAKQYLNVYRRIRK